MATKFKIQNLDTNATISFESNPWIVFNPTEYSVGMSSDLSQKCGKTQFNGLSLDDFNLKLLFDTYEDGKDVRKETIKIAKLAMPSVNGKTTQRPPVVLITWGGFKYKGVIKNVSQNFTMFLASGVPVRAELEITVENTLSDSEILKNNGWEACRKLWVVKSNDRLDLVAERELKDARQWRAIAAANNITDPASFPGPADIGRTLVIPDIYV